MDYAILWNQTETEVEYKLKGLLAFDFSSSTAASCSFSAAHQSGV